MHPNPAFRQTPAAEALRIATARGFGVLTVAGGAAGPLAAHVPFEVAEDGNGGGAELRLHLARSNPIARAALPLPALMVVSGPDAYVSPDWYGLPDQVPTWNYIAVHLRGRLEALPAEALLPHLDAVSAAFEARLAPKPAWRTAKMTPAALAGLMRAILPFRLVLEAVESTVKLNQNKPEAAREGAAQGIAAAPVGMGAADIAAAMRRGGPA